MSAPTWPELAVLYANAAIRSEVKYREQKELFDAYKSAYEAAVADARDPIAMIDAACRAGSDPRRSDALKAATWYRDEVVMYAALAQMAAQRG